MLDSAAIRPRSITRTHPYRRAATATLGAAAVACAIVVTARAGHAVGAVPWTIRPSRLLGATIVELTGLAWAVHLWSRILARFDGPQPTYRELLRVWRVSTLAKYLPGSVWSAATTVEMATRLGVSAVALPSSFLLQGTLNLVGAITVAALFGRATQAAGSGVPTWLAAGAVLAGLALVHPRVIGAAVRAGARVGRRPAPDWHGSWLTGAWLLLGFTAAWLTYGAAFALFLSAILPTAPIRWLDLAGMNALAFSAGFVAIFSPGGIGVREAALVGLLAPAVPGAATRIGLAAASRLWLVLTECVGAAVVVVAGRSTTTARPWVVDHAPTARRRTRFAPPRVERPTVHHGVDVGLLTDTRRALGDITAACAAATRSIRIAQLAFDADCVAGETADAPEPAVARTLLETIVDVARRRTPEGTPVDVRVLLNGGLLLDTSPALRRAIAALGATAHVQVRTVRAFPRVMHAKLLVVDDVDAFVTGASFVNGYWDDARIVRSTAPDAADEGHGDGDRPLHDAAIRVRGAAASELGDWFDALWEATPPGGANGGATTPARRPRATTAPVATPVATPVAAGGSPTSRACSVQVLRTIPSSAASPAGRTEILDAYLEAIGRARSCIYLESQYFSARPIARAVRAALDAHPALECILVVNQNPDVTAYRGWQDARLMEHELLAHPRVGTFALWGTAPSPRTAGRAEVTQVFVHSKVAVIDDAWATLGTANLDGASLHSYGDDFAWRPTRRAFRDYRNYDLNVAVLDGVDGAPRTGVAAALRRRLWARHLGLPEAALATRPDDGWLPLWRARADAHVAELALGGRPAPHGRALPYVPRAHPRAQLAALGIEPAVAGLDLRFDPSWLEVHCSPGWMLKLLPERVRRWL